MEGHIGLHEVICLNPQRIGESCFANPMAVSNYSPTASRTRVPFGHAIKVGFMPIFWGKRPLSLLSFHHPILFPLHTFASLFKFSPLSNSIVFSHSTIYVICKNKGRSFPFSEDSIISLFLYSPVEMWKSLGENHLCLYAFIQKISLAKEILDAG